MHGSKNHLSNRTLLAILLLSLTLIAPAASAVDWPQWRGPNRDGVSTETGLLKDWPAGGPPLVWKTKGLGDGYSTVSVVGDRIFTAGERADSSFVTALNVEDGKPVWSAKLGKSGEPGGYKGPRNAPTVAGGLIFDVGQFGELVCLEQDTGHERWRKDFVKDLGGQPPYWGFAEAPLVADHVIRGKHPDDRIRILAFDQKCCEANGWRGIACGGFGEDLFVAQSWELRGDHRLQVVIGDDPKVFLACERSQARDRLLDHGAVAVERQHLLGKALAAERPEARAAAAGKDHGMEIV